MIPDLAVIFLVRDPRGMISSQMRVFRYSKVLGLPTFAPKLCHKMLTDVNAARELYGKAASRLRFLRYEDLASDPVEVSRRIYRFLRLDWSPSILATISRQTQAESQSDMFRGERRAHGIYGVSRDDSYQAANRWRRSISWENLVTIENACRDVMQLLGYVTFDSVQELRNLTLPSRGRFPSEGLLSLSDANSSETEMTVNI